MSISGRFISRRCICISLCEKPYIDSQIESESSSRRRKEEKKRSPLKPMFFLSACSSWRPYTDSLILLPCHLPSNHIRAEFGSQYAKPRFLGGPFPGAETTKPRTCLPTCTTKFKRRSKLVPGLSRRPVPRKAPEARRD